MNGFPVANVEVERVEQAPQCGPILSPRFTALPVHPP
jgi:hypothetical protein